MPISNTPDNQVKLGNKAKPKKNNIKLKIIIVLAVVAFSSAGVYFYFNKTAGANTGLQQAQAPKTTEIETLDMGEMVVNLTGNGGGHYLRINITLEYPKDKKLSGEMKKKKAQLMDTIITTLRGKTLEEVSPVGASTRLKENLIDEINKNLDGGTVTGIYFTDYLVQ